MPAHVGIEGNDVADGVARSDLHRESYCSGTILQNRMLHTISEKHLWQQECNVDSRGKKLSNNHPQFNLVI